MTEQDYNTMPLGELEKMVSGMSVADMDTSKTDSINTEGNSEEKKEDSSQTTADSTETPESKEEEKTDSDKEEEKSEEKEEKEEKKTPESIKKLLHQRSELRQDNDRLRSELAEAQELVKKLRSWELDSEFKNSEGEVDMEKKEEAIQDASFNSKMIERELNNSNRTISNTRESQLAQFLLDNPDLNDVKEDIVEYANKHKDLDFEDVKYLVLSKIDPTRLLDEQTKNKLSGNYSIPWKSYDWKEDKKEEEDPKKMSLDKLQKIIVEKGLI